LDWLHESEDTSTGYEIKVFEKQTQCKLSKSAKLTSKMLIGSDAPCHNVQITDMLSPLIMSANNTIPSIRYTRDRPASPCALTSVSRIDCL
ncbi:hypothetical protein BDZ91DRAFT_756798, partial [Kalaharituber pfeilii]